MNRVELTKLNTLLAGHVLLPENLQTLDIKYGAIVGGASISNHRPAK
jgi:hypothetical protein